MEQIPGTEKIVFKPAFVEQYKKLLGDRYEEFIRISLSWARKCIRVNTLKMPISVLVERLKKNWALSPVPWCKEGFYIAGSRWDVGNLLEHTLGYIYVQESASMIPPLVLDPHPGEIVLDLCAAPGSKTSQIAQYMKNQGIIVANDVAHNRLAALGINLQRCGVANAITTMMRGTAFKGLACDKVLVDAPCSGVGTIRRSLKTVQEWNPKMVTVLAAQQKALLRTGFANLKPGGVLVYSTCTLEPEENEEVVSWLLEKEETAVLEAIELPVKRSSCILEWNEKKYHADVEKCLRIWPQDNDSEGFFVAKIRKSS